MGSILPKIEKLQEIPELHEKYACSLLKLVLDKLLQEQELDIGIKRGANPDEVYSIISFDSDELENCNIELTFSIRSRIELIVNDHSEDMFTSTFTYRIIEGTPIYKLLPVGLIDIMEEVVFEGESRKVSAKNLKGK